MFDDIRGHGRQKALLQKQSTENQVSHAYLFHGPEGTGKRKLAAEFLAEQIAKGSADPDRVRNLVGRRAHPDFISLGEEASGKNATIKIGEVRDVIQKVTVLPLEGGIRGILIDNADKMTPEAQNALLKTLEEPPANNIFVLVTSRTDRIIPTVLSRCEKIPFGDLTGEELAQVLTDLGLPDIPDAQTPAEAIRLNESPETLEQLEMSWRMLTQVLSGKKSAIYKLAERCAESPEISSETLSYFAEKLRRIMLASPEQAAGIADLESILLELMENLQYNINLRLQWERCLIKLQTSGVHIDESVSNRRAV